MNKFKKVCVVVTGLILGTAASSAAGAQTGPIKFGLQFPITGSLAVEGQGVENALRLLIKQRNAKGGLLGRKVELVVCDDEGQPAKAAICARRLVNEGVLAVVGSYTSGATLAAGPIYAKANVILSSDGTSNELTRKGWTNFFRNDPPNSAEAKFTAHYLVDVRNYKRIAIITDHSVFATGLADNVEKAIKGVGGHVIDKAFINAGTQDYTAVLTKLKASNPDVIYFSGYYPDGGLIKAQMQQLDIDAQFVGGDANQSDAFIKIAGDAAAGAIIINIPSPANLPYPLTKKFLAAYKSAYGAEPPSIYTFTNADGLRSIFAAIDATKSTDPAKLEDWLHDMPAKYEGFTGNFKWDENGERVGSLMTAFQVQADGSYKILYPNK